MTVRATLLRYALGAVVLATLAGDAAAQFVPPPPRTPAAPPAPSAASEPLATPMPPSGAPVAPTPSDPPVPVEPPAPEPAPEPTPGPAPAPPASKDDKPAVTARYDKGFVLSSADDAFQTRIALRTQFRFESTRPTEDGAEFQSRSYIARARLQLEGHVYGADNRYRLEIALGDRGSFTFVRDAFLERKVSGVWLRAGQWKRPHNRQELVSDFSSVFNERAITAELVGGGRDMGFAVHNDYEKSPEGLEWVLGVFNTFAGGADRPVLTTTCTLGAMAITCRNAAPSNFPADFGPTLVGRIGWNHGKIKGYSEGDLEGGPLRFAIGASYKVDLANFDEGMQSSVAGNFSHSVSVDAMVKVNGFDLLAGLYLNKVADGEAKIGGLVQTGYFLTPKKIQIAARFAMHEDLVDDGRSLIEGRAALNYYVAGHAFKLATDAGMTQLTGEDVFEVADKPDLNLRVMGQMTF